MKTAFYYPELRMAISEEPLSLAKEDEVRSFSTGLDEVVPLEELGNYFIKFYDNRTPDFFFPLLRCSTGSCIVREEYSDHLFEVSFRNSVGMTRIGPLKVRVKSKKIPEKLYHSMLDYIAGHYANLVFSFDVPLGQAYEKKKLGKDIPYIEYLFLRRYLLDGDPDLDGIAGLILANPDMKLQSEYRNSPIEEVSSLHPGVLFGTLMKADGYTALTANHPLLSTRFGKSLNRKAGKCLYPHHVLEERRFHAVDTAGNRFVKYFMKSIQRRLDGIARSLSGISGGFLNPDIEEGVRQIGRRVDTFLKNPFWQDVGTITFVPTNSQVLQRREGYRQLFSLYSLLHLCTNCDFSNEDFKNLLEMKDTPTLFEYWSFILIKEILDGTRKLLSCSTIISGDPKEQKMLEGIRIRYEGGVDLYTYPHNLDNSLRWTIPPLSE